MEDVYYLSPGAGEEFYFAINPFGDDRVRGQIHNVADNTAGLSIKISYFEYKIHSFALSLNFEPEGGFSKRLLGVLYDGRIKETIERLNFEWLKKMWNVSEDDSMVFMFEQIAKKFDSSLEGRLSVRERLEAIRRRDIQLFNYEKTAQSEQDSTVQTRPRTLD